MTLLSCKSFLREYLEWLYKPSLSMSVTILSDSFKDRILFINLFKIGEHRGEGRKCLCVWEEYCMPCGLKGHNCPTKIAFQGWWSLREPVYGFRPWLLELALRVQSALSFRIFLFPQHGVSASVSWKLELFLPRMITGCTNSTYGEAHFWIWGIRKDLLECRFFPFLKPLNHYII